MKYQINTSITINATPKTVWKTLTDFESYPQWNHFIKSINGDVAVANQINVHVDTMKFSPIVKSFENNSSLIWQGKLWIKGLFDGEHSFKLQDNNDGTTTFIHSESFRGVLVGMMKKKLATYFTQKFNEMNERLKERVEGLKK